MVVQDVTGESKASQLRPTCACSHALFGSMPFSSRFRNGCVLMSAPHLCHQYQVASWHICYILRQAMQARAAQQSPSHPCRLPYSHSPRYTSPLTPVYCPRPLT